MVSRPDPAMDTAGDALATRAVAFAIDAVVVVVAGLLVRAVGNGVRIALDDSFVLLDGAVPPAAVAAWLLTWAAVAATVGLYYAASYAVAGQSLGKRMTDVVVVERDGDPCGWRAALVRTAVLLAPLPVVAVLDAVLGFTGVALGLVLAAGWVVVELVALALDGDGRRLGDRLAGTVVVKEALAGV